MKLATSKTEQIDAGYLRLVTDVPVGFPNPATAQVAVIGLGYVGLPLVIGFSTNSRSLGFDINTQKIKIFEDFRS